MATKVFMEALSPTMEEGRLVKWLKNEGDAVKSGDVLAEVETDKAIMELVARGDGMLRKRLINEGDTVPVGTLAGVIAAADENIDALVAGAAPAAAPLPRRPRRSSRAARRSQPPLVDPQPPQESQGEASTPPQQRPPTLRPLPPCAAPAAPPRRSGRAGDVRSSPLARRLAAERGLDLAQRPGHGPEWPHHQARHRSRRSGRRCRASGRRRSGAERAASSRASGDFHDVPLTQIRKTIAKRLGESIGPIPTFYLTAEFDLTRVAEMREAMAELGDEFKVSVNDILLKAIALALSQHPEVNAHWLGDKIRYHNRVHLGMAVATDDGLIMPVIWDADRKRMSEISREAKELAKRARERKLKPEEYTGSTFSVSNLGMFGIDQFTAIINPPEAGILAIGDERGEARRRRTASRWSASACASR